MCVCLSVSVFATPWTVACQSSLTMGFPRQEYWSELPFRPAGDLPDTEIKPIISCFGRWILYHWTIWEAHSECLLDVKHYTDLFICCANLFFIINPKVRYKSTQFIVKRKLRITEVERFSQGYMMMVAGRLIKFICLTTERNSQLVGLFFPQ